MHRWCSNLEELTNLAKQNLMDILPRIHCRDEHDGDLKFDLGNLMAYDAVPVEAATFAGGVEAACQKLATNIFQALTRQLFELPSEPAPVGRIAKLPAPTTVLPREKPVPKPKPPTKWELFAQRKGIVKRKRSALEFDENSQEWKRRYGYKKANDEAAVPIIEAGRHETTGVEDPFTRLSKEKKERVKKQDSQQLANLKNAVKTGGKGALPATLKLAATLPEHGRGAPTKRKELVPELKNSLRQATGSTASMGKFDKMLKGETAKDRQAAAGKKRKFMAVAETGAERAAQGKVVDHILRKNADDIVDIGRAIGKFEAEAREDRRQVRMKMKGANKKGRLTGGKKAGGKPPAGKDAAKKGGKGKGKK